MSDIPFWDGYSTFANGVITGPAIGPLFSDNPWDTVILDGNGANRKQLPGICRVRGLPTLGIDKKKSNGRDGAVLTVNGYLPGPIEIESIVWTPEQWSEWQRIIPGIWRKPTSGSVKGSALALDIQHPAFQFAGINKVIIIGLGPPEKGPFAQSMVIKLKALEFVPPGAASLKTVQAEPAGPPVTKDYQTQNAPPAPSKGGNGLGGPRPSTLGGAV